jgi:hypothetical protein
MGIRKSGGAGASFFRLRWLGPIAVARNVNERAKADFALANPQSRIANPRQ